MFDSRKQKPESNSGDTWRQVLADIRNVLGISSDSSIPKATNETLTVSLEKQPSQQAVPSSSVQESADAQSAGSLEQLTSPMSEANHQEMATPIEPVSRFRHISSSERVKLLIGISVIIVLIIGIFREEIFAPWPPSPDVVATFTGGQITIEDVKKHLVTLAPAEDLQKQLTTPQGYQLIVEEMIADELARRWSENRKPEQDKGFSHVMKHLTEEVNLDQLHAQMHQGKLGVTESDIQAYFEANKKDFGDKTLTDVRDQIQTTLQSEKEDQFVQNYITGLKNKASITKEATMLAVPEPTESELKNYYEANKNLYIRKAEARIQEIRIPKDSDEKKAKEKADQTLSAIRSGEDFGSTFQSTVGAPMPQDGQRFFKGERDPAYEEVIFRLEPGNVSEVIQTADAFVIVKLLSKDPERQFGFDEVRRQIVSVVGQEKERKHFSDNADRTLFTVNGKRFTVGEFWEEYQELPVTFLANYQGVNGKQELVDTIIERTLLYEDSLNQVSQTDTKERKDEIRLKVLAQMLEQEEVDDKIKIEEKEVERFYQENQEKFIKPPKSKIRQIAIRAGETEDEHKRAEEKVTEAYKKLTSGLLNKDPDFAAIAREYSEDETTKNEGGEMSGWIEEQTDLFGELTAHPYHERIQSLELGKISSPFEWNGYFYIVQVTERTKPEQFSYEEAKAYIQEYLKQQKHVELTQQLSQKLLKDARVKIYSRTLQRL